MAVLIHGEGVSLPQTTSFYQLPGMKPQPISLRDYHQPANRVRQQLCNMQARDGDQSPAAAGDRNLV
jgi:hypothetical protein